MRIISKLAGLIAVATAISLAGCSQESIDTGISPSLDTASSSLPSATEVAPSDKTLESIIPPRPQGPHGQHDPHSTLSPDKHVQVALQHLKEGRPFEAMEVLNKTIMQYPDYAEAMAIRGSLLLEQGKPTDALRDLEATIQLDPDNAQALTNRAQAYRQFGRIEEAIKDLNHAIEVNPNLIAALFNRGAISFSSNEFESALKDFEACIALDPHSAAPYFNRAATYEAMNRQQEAIADLEHFIKLSESEQWKVTAQELIDKWTSSETAAEESSPKS